MTNGSLIPLISLIVSTLFNNISISLAVVSPLLGHDIDNDDPLLSRNLSVRRHRLFKEGKLKRTQTKDEIASAPAVITHKRTDSNGSDDNDEVGSSKDDGQQHYISNDSFETQSEQGDGRKEEGPNSDSNGSFEGLGKMELDGKTLVPLGNVGVTEDAKRSSEEEDMNPAQEDDGVSEESERIAESEGMEAAAASDGSSEAADVAASEGNGEGSFDYIHNGHDTPEDGESHVLSHENDVEHSSDHDEGGKDHFEIVYCEEEENPIEGGLTHTIGDNLAPKGHKTAKNKPKHDQLAPRSPNTATHEHNHGHGHSDDDHHQYSGAGGGGPAQHHIEKSRKGAKSAKNAKSAKAKGAKSKTAKSSQVECTPRPTQKPSVADAIQDPTPVPASSVTNTPNSTEVEGTTTSPTHDKIVVPANPTLAPVDAAATTSPTSARATVAPTSASATTSPTSLIIPTKSPTSPVRMTPGPTTGNETSCALLDPNPDGFEDETFPSPPWSTGGSGNWALTTDRAFSGSSSIKSPDLGGQESAVSNATLTTCDGFPGGIVKVQVIASVFPPRDVFVVYVDGESAAQMVEVHDWKTVELDLDRGAHRVDFSYQYNLFGVDPLPPSPSRREGAVWIDNVEIETIEI